MSEDQRFHFAMKFLAISSVTFAVHSSAVRVAEISYLIPLPLATRGRRSQSTIGYLGHHPSLLTFPLWLRNFKRHQPQRTRRCTKGKAAFQVESSVAILIHRSVRAIVSVFGHLLPTNEQNTFVE
jgi:hypothetical protein